ncbi:ATP-binding protein [Bifidobacterium sp. ESL0800]|uniref:ATP-binding protein n=1 Tax=Bifidobacterium sp. ESL0800 TaxID=2983236 RepID=UPI0023F7646B|nr:ATP-binding protein [Bifidobacterium sp. ESL0800]WEV75435.1 ATP-binding protein [Bifidobacterium sp. ESL0800]
MIPRLLTNQANKLAGWFPVVSVTGPRQSGKSTLIRSTFPDYEYINLENPDIRRTANEDPVGFIQNRPSRLILDEAQYAPDLFSMIQVASDERNETGQYILSGSQNFLLLKNIKQSLAGRVGILKLLPLSFSEAQKSEQKPTIDEFMLRGGYPRPYDTGMDLSAYFSSYISSYLERDVADYLGVRDVSTFRTFLRLCAQNAGNLLNYTHMASDLGTSFRTVKGWLSILESSYITFPLLPYFKSAGKRLTKTPKLYFYDTGLLCHLLGIKTLPQLLTHPMLGAIFENLIVAETAKHHFNNGVEPELYFYRDTHKREVDLLDLTDSELPFMAEIKSSQTYHGKYGTTLTEIGEALNVPAEKRAVIYRGEGGISTKQFRVLNGSAYLTFSE